MPKQTRINFNVEGDLRDVFYHYLSEEGLTVRGFFTKHIKVFIRECRKKEKKILES